MLRFPPPLTPQGFLECHWQKQALHLPGGMPQMAPAITADELAWLATLDDVESRLILSEHRRDKTHYYLEDGPFSEQRLAGLAAGNWTLLVHDVDKHLPAFRVHLEATGFIPDWRIDDLMISVAGPGGSVGPHVDNYDVFLCQAEGEREWRLAEPAAAIRNDRDASLALLEPFACAAPLIAGPADVLYLPPGVPHWGIAVDRCITWSLGMRAPTRSELLNALADVRNGGEAGIAQATDTTTTFYADADLQTEEADPGLISPQAIERAFGLIGRDPQVPLSRLARAFGELVTTPKEWLAPEAPGADEAIDVGKRLSQSGDAVTHGMARLAWCMLSADSALLFVNGRSRPADARELAEFRRLCKTRRWSHARGGKPANGSAGLGMLNWLVAAGAFSLDGFEVGEDDLG